MDKKDIDNTKRIERRYEFLIHLYDNLWRSIDRVENSMWQFLIFYGAVFATSLMLLFQLNLTDTKSGFIIYISKYLLFIIIMLSFAGVNIIIERNKWFNRNRLFIINLEKEFLFKEDLGKIMPESYHNKEVKVLDTISIMYMGMLLVIPLLMLWNLRNAIDNSWDIFAIWIILGIFTLYNYYHAKEEIRRFIKETQ